MLKIEREADVCQTSIEGEMNIYNATALKESLQPLFTETHEVEVDLAKVSEIDSAGVQLLMLLKKERAAQDKALALVNHSAAVLDAFELMGLVGWFNDPVVLTREKGERHGI